MSLVLEVVRQFETMGESEIEAREKSLLGIPRMRAERALLCALRISRAVPDLTHLEAIASRWTAANGDGAGGGLLAGVATGCWRAAVSVLTVSTVVTGACTVDGVDCVPTTGTSGVRGTLISGAASLVTVLSSSLAV